MHTFLVVIQVISALAVIGLVLVQHGKGADAGAAFGSGASGTVFGSRGSANFLTHATAAAAGAFFLASLALAYVVQGRKSVESVVDGMAPAATATVPSVAEVPAEGPAIPAAAEDAPKVPE